MLSIGLSGFCFYSHDVGGFSGNPSPELFVRWLQLGSSPRTCVRTARRRGSRGSTASRRRTSAALSRAALPADAVPLDGGGEGAAAALPVARPLLLSFPDDPVAWTIDDAYMFGPDILVAPVMVEGAVGRSVYLPAGRWWDFWTGPRSTGALRRGGRTARGLPLFVVTAR
jgi:alpha-glucosidase (family GH31 glycosyl hydrolase)